MPELPEAETIRRGVTPLVVGRTIDDVVVTHRRGIRRQSVESFRDMVAGEKILNSDRRGKAILFYLTGKVILVFRLGMSGRLVVAPAGKKLLYDRVRMGLGGKQFLILEDPRTFGEAYALTGTHWTESEEFCDMGPEPLAQRITAPLLAEKFNCEAPMGLALMDQHRLAGLGKIYADEALFAAGIHPLRKSRRVSVKEWKNLICVIRKILRAAIRLGGTTAGDGAYRDSEGREGRYASRLKVYQRTGEPCLVCGSRIKRYRVQKNRGLHYCPTCQAH